MKKYLLFLFLLVTFETFAKDYKLGDTLKDAITNIKHSDIFKTEDLGLWPENKVSIYKIDDGNLVLFSMNYYPFGVITKDGDKSIFLIDYNGDSILDCQPELLFVPPWVVDINSKGADNGDTLRRLFNLKLLAYSENNTPSKSPHMIAFAKELVRIAQDIKSEDRIFFYLDFLHDVLYTRNEYLIDKACLANLESVASKTKEARSVWLIHAIELTYASNELDLCKKYIQELLTINNTFVPGLYYQYLIEQNINVKEKYRSILIKKYSEHWVVKYHF